MNRQIKAQELQHTLSSMVGKLSDAEFKELMRTLDPGGSGLVDINRFLELLEESHGEVSAAAALRVRSRGKRVLSEIRGAGAVRFNQTHLFAEVTFQLR